ncbi:MAG TPA: pyruvate formate lyase family protein [Oscillospiraceae bacterium]|nr:pyruvate formate lyase family protein [Oscillospiraceae bacterium]HPS35511.1 pyruvate formate lyase family protein [Oscillospiraceae bacterium]
MNAISAILSPEQLAQKAKLLFKEEQATNRLDGWFFIQEIRRDCDAKFAGQPAELKAANTLKVIAEKLPISLSENAVFAGTQRDAFARSYALINPTFKVQSFSGYCDPTAVFDDITPEGDLTKERIETLRAYNAESAYVKTLAETYRQATDYTGEVCFFIEQVTGHVIPDMRVILAQGIDCVTKQIEQKLSIETDPERKTNLYAMKIALESALILAARYARLTRKQAETAEEQRKSELLLLAHTLEKVPAKGAAGLFEAIQSFILLWQMMCIEQSPNPFAFSVGNADRIFEPYRKAENMSRETAAALFRHFLVFFNVGDRSWAISQNVLVGGKDTSGNDLTNDCTCALLDAYYDMNLPQPILSVKLHQNTPDALYQALGKFFFTPGCLTPSLFNDDSLFPILASAGIEQADLPDYSIAGCQEPLIMGKDNGNTTNSWLNLGKILELTLLDGVSAISGKPIGPKTGIHNALDRLKNIRKLFYKNVEFYIAEMAKAANNATKALSYLPVPFISTLMSGIESGYDMRDVTHQGTKYNGSGCLIHGLTVVADSFIAIDMLLSERPQDTDRLIEALRTNFEHDEDLRQYLSSCEKFGNNFDLPDEEAKQVAEKVSDIVASQRNLLSNPFRPDFSTPSTHLLYGYWVSATPDGRKSHDMLKTDSASGCFRALTCLMKKCAAAMLPISESTRNILKAIPVKIKVLNLRRASSHRCFSTA